MGKKKSKDNMIELLDNAIEQLCDDMLKHKSDSEEYSKMNRQLAQLITTRSAIKDDKKFNWALWAPILANLLGIILIMSYEQTHVIATKAFSHVIKTKL